MATNSDEPITEPTRLRHTEAGPLRVAIEAARADLPPSQRWAAIGAAALSAAAVSTSGAAAGTGLAIASQSKLVIALSLLGAAGGTGVYLATRPIPARVMMRAPEPAPGRPAAAAPAVVMPNTEPEAPPAARPVVRPKPQAPVATSSARAIAPMPAAAADGINTLVQETELLDDVRRTLPSSPGQALSLLDRYQVRFPTGILDQEASVLRIEALVKSGDQDGARRQATLFARRHPRSAHLWRARHLVEGAAETPNR